MFQKIALLFVMVSIVSVTTAALAQPADKISTLRGTALTKEAKAPPISRVYNGDKKQTRNYPEQPPTIPHAIRNYQIDANTNRCMFCHARSATAESQAPAISITHYMDRDGQFLATASPRRYFCTQCHVSQTEAKQLVPNTFIDIDSLLQKKSKK